MSTTRTLKSDYTRGELTCIDSIHLDSAKVYKTLVKGRTVYGGGGIMPDIFVPLDTTTYSPYYRALRRYNLINEWTLRYVDDHRKELKRKYRKFEDFDKNFEVPASLTDSIMAEGKRKRWSLRTTRSASRHSRICSLRSKPPLPTTSGTVMSTSVW